MIAFLVSTFPETEGIKAAFAFAFPGTCASPRRFGAQRGQHQTLKGLKPRPEYGRDCLRCATFTRPDARACQKLACFPVESVRAKGSGRKKMNLRNRPVTCALTPSAGISVAPAVNAAWPNTYCFPSTLNPEPETRNPQPPNLKSKPETRSPKPQTLNPKP